MRWLRRHGYLDAETDAGDAPPPTPLDDFTRIALGGGTIMGRPFTPRPNDHEAALYEKPKRYHGFYNGFDVHCAVRIRLDDDEGRERLVRYCARPPFALERLEELPNGSITYLMKTPRKGRTHRESVQERSDRRATNTSTSVKSSAR